MDADILVIGAGPVGLTLAAELRLAGADPVVLERSATPTREPRARGLGPLAAEALRRRGLGDRLAEHHAAGQADLASDHGSEKQHFAWIHKIDRPDRAPTYIWQPDLERMLADHAAGLGVTVRRAHTLTGLVQDADGVTATVRTPEGEVRLSAEYLVGCDGGRSTVRKLTGFDFPGTPPIMIGRRATAHVDASAELPPPGRTPTGALFHGGGKIGTFVFGDALDVPEGPLTPAELADSVRQVSGIDVTVSDLGGTLRFTDNARQVTDYRSGRVLLAGDAAHVHSANGGQGLNLGIIDAVNLGWKLAATVLGRAPEGLLDSYTAERHPAGAAVLHNTRAQSALLRPGPHVDALRDIVAELMDIPEANRYFGRMMNGLDTRYAFDYPAVHPLVGQHCPSFTVRTADGAELPWFELAETGRPLLLYPSGDPGVRGRADVVEVAAIDHPDLEAALIRPDGVVAWAGGPGLEIALATWFGQ